MKNRNFKPFYKACKECLNPPSCPTALQAIAPAKKDEPKTPPAKGIEFRDWVFEYDQRSTYEWAKEMQRKAMVGPKF